MKKELIELAKEKGFESITSIVYQIADVENDNPDLFYYLWCCELQKWLIEKYFIYVDISFLEQCGWKWQIIPLREQSAYLGFYDRSLESDTFALEGGLFKALKLID
jgi:hypothetical protein